MEETPGADSMKGMWHRKDEDSPTLHCLLSAQCWQLSYGAAPIPTPCPTFGQPQLLQLAGQGLAIHIVLGCTGENEVEDGDRGLHITRLCREERIQPDGSQTPCGRLQVGRVGPLAAAEEQDSPNLASDVSFRIFSYCGRREQALVTR